MLVWRIYICTNKTKFFSSFLRNIKRKHTIFQPVRQSYSNFSFFTKNSISNFKFLANHRTTNFHALQVKFMIFYCFLCCYTLIHLYIWVIPQESGNFRGEFETYFFFYLRLNFLVNFIVFVQQHSII